MRGTLKLETVCEPNTDICIIIDSRVDNKDMDLLYKRNRVLLSKCNHISTYSKTRRITILFKKKTGVTVGNILYHDNHNILIFSIMTPSNNTIDIAAIYGPSDRDDPEFFQTVLDALEDRGNEHRVIIGDWNTTLNRDLDEKDYISDTHRKTRELLRGWEEGDIMYDALRVQNPTAKNYTWRTRAGQAGRLDMMWISEKLLGKTYLSSHFNNINTTDHHTLLATIDLETHKEGPGVFRAKIGIQNNPQYQKLIKNAITETIFAHLVHTDSTWVQYALFRTRCLIEQDLDSRIHNAEHVDPPLAIAHKQLQLALLMSNEPTVAELLDMQTHINKAELHEKVLTKIKEKTIMFTKTMKKETKIHTQHLKAKLGELLDTNVNGSNDVEISDTQELIDNLEAKWLKTILENNKDYSLIDDEKPSKRFLNMESGKGGYSNITLLNPEIGVLITDPAKIRATVHKDFQKIYSKQEGLKTDAEDLKKYLNSDEDTAPYEEFLKRKLNFAEKTKMEGKIEEHELTECLFKKMKGGSAPGIDGLTVSWLRAFWPEMRKLTAQAINTCYESGTLTNTMNTAVVKLLRKGDKDPTKTNNYRPISLLSIHYKLASCTITQRIKPVMTRLIGRQQKAYVSNNVIGSCLINLISMMKHVSEKRMNALILLIDFRKAFDSIDLSFIRTVMTEQGFGDNIIKWVTMFFDKREAFILMGGHQTDKILLEQGVPQGDVISPYIFILMVEILLIKINYSKHIKGVTFANDDYRSETFADDTSIVIERNEEYLKKAIKFIKDFHEISGLKCNVDKTVVIPIGANTDKKDVICPELGVSWDNNFRLLGFDIDNKLEKLNENFEKCHIRVKKLILKWRRYNLSILGRITVTKSVLLAQYTYFAAVLDMKESDIKRLQNTLDNFILYNSYLSPNTKMRRWIRDDILYSPKHAGGLAAIRIDDFILSLKTSWIHRYASKLYDDHWCDKLDTLLGLTRFDREKFLRWGSNKWAHLVDKKIPLLSSMLRSFLIFSNNFVDGVNKHNHRWLEQPLFMNPNIKGGLKLSMRPKDYMISEDNTSLTAKVSDLYNDGVFKTMAELENVGLRVPNFLSYMRLKQDMKNIVGEGNHAKYKSLPLLTPINYKGTKPIHMRDTIVEFMNGIIKGSNKFREIIALRRKKAKVVDVQRFKIKLGDDNCSHQQVKKALLNFHDTIMPKEASDYKLRAILGKTQFGNTLTKWSNASDGTCHRCGSPETFRHAIYTCTMIRHVYKDVLDTIGISNYSEDITSIILSQRRLPKSNERNLMIIDVINSMTLKNILSTRSQKSVLNIKNTVREILSHLKSISRCSKEYGAFFDQNGINFDPG